MHIISQIHVHLTQCYTTKDNTRHHYTLGLSIVRIGNYTITVVFLKPFGKVRGPNVLLREESLQSFQSKLRVSISRRKDHIEGNTLLGDRGKHIIRSLVPFPFDTSNVT